MDNLPAATILDDDEFVTTEYVGYPIGYQEGQQTYLYNHVNIIIEYHTIEEDAHRVVGFYVEPLSVKHSFVGGEWEGKGPAPALTTCQGNKALNYEDIRKGQQQKLEAGNLVFTYGVEFRESEVQWASRWDVYLTMNNAVSDNVHWFSIVNSLLIVVFLSFMIAMILVRTLNRDITRYNRIETEEEKAEDKEESGWKLVHADVFRPPANLPLIFCVIIGTGMQLIVCAFFLIVFAAVGFLSPASRGSIMIGMLLIFVLMGSLAGFTSARLYKTFRGKMWQRCTLLTAVLFPGIAFSIFFILNFVVWSYGSTGAVPFLSMLAVLTLWFGISVPLVFLGAYFGYKKDPIEYPTVTSSLPREVPKQAWFLNPLITLPLGGVLPFGACFVELFFVMSSLWLDQYYYVFGFLLLVFVILTVTCAEVTTVLCYFQLCAEDYRWWWRSILSSGSTALYVFIYSIIYFARLEPNMGVTYVLYFGYMGLICLGVFLATGTMGFFACLYFNFQIYSSIKVD